MSQNGVRGLWSVVLSLAIAVFCTILPMPSWAEDLRPQWVALTLIFWALALPDRVGVFWAFGAGLVLDAAVGAPFGQHALGLSLVAYVTVELHPRLRIFPMWQQTLFVWVLLLVERLMFLWVLAATGQPTPTLVYWAPTVMGMVLWPWISVVLRDLGRRAGAI
jgi:rod shape-determining protein MreD